MAAFLEERYGTERATTLRIEARKEYEHLLPGMPDLSGRQPFTQFVVTTAWTLAFYRALGSTPAAARQAGELAYALTTSYLDSLPLRVRRLIGSVWFARWFVKRARRRAERSQHRRHSGDFVYRFVPGDGDRFDWGVDYLECGVVSFLRAQKALDLAPYICALDQVSSEALGWGLMRTATLADGQDHCDFRFKRGGPTVLASSVLPISSVPTPVARDDWEARGSDG
jgi:hypothetical protein